MKKQLPWFCTIITLLFCVCHNAESQNVAESPRAEISNELMTVKLFLPDAQAGFYRATRFDWSGIIESLEYKGHSYFGRWFDNYSPTAHDAVMGPAEEFGALGYNEAKPGETFVKIGVGALRRTSESAYNRFDLYEIVDHGKWAIHKKSDEITFVHEIDDPCYAYEYTKTIRLILGSPEMEVLHTLQNKGKCAINTDVYDHNFFVIDQRTTGPEFEVVFPFEVKVEPKRPKKAVSETTTTKTVSKRPERKENDLSEIAGNKIGFKRKLVEGETVRVSPISGFGKDPKYYDIKVKNRETGAGVRIVGDQPLSKIVLWASPKTLCPEAYIDIAIEPGQQFNWMYTYKIQ